MHVDLPSRTTALVSMCECSGGKSCASPSRPHQSLACLNINQNYLNTNTENYICDVITRPTTQHELQLALVEVLEPLERNDLVESIKKRFHLILDAAVEAELHHQSDERG